MYVLLWFALSLRILMSNIPNNEKRAGITNRPKYRASFCAFVHFFAMFCKAYTSSPPALDVCVVYPDNSVTEITARRPWRQMKSHAQISIFATKSVSQYNQRLENKPNVINFRINEDF